MLMRGPWPVDRPDRSALQEGSKGPFPEGACDSQPLTRESMDQAVSMPHCVAHGPWLRQWRAPDASRARRGNRSTTGETRGSACLVLRTRALSIPIPITPLCRCVICHVCEVVVTLSAHSAAHAGPQEREWLVKGRKTPPGALHRQVCKKSASLRGVATLTQTTAIRGGGGGLERMHESARISTSNRSMARNTGNKQTDCHAAPV